MFGEAGKIGDLDVEDAVALAANQVWMWRSLSAIIAVAVILEAQLGNFSDVFQQGYRFIDGCQARRRETNAHLGIHFLRGWMLSALR